MKTSLRGHELCVSLGIAATVLCAALAVVWNPMFIIPGILNAVGAVLNSSTARLKKAHIREEIWAAAGRALLNEERGDDR